MQVAKDLDFNNIVWERPSFLKYKDSKGNYRKYFPDFYLLDYNVYLDPKNDYLIKRDIEKIRRVCLYNNVKVFILNEDQLCWKKIRTIILTNGL